MSYTKMSVIAIFLCIVTALFGQDNCDCHHWPFDPPTGCNEICTRSLNLDHDGYTYSLASSNINDQPRSNWMASDAAFQLFRQGFPRTGQDGPPITSAKLYATPEEFDWVDVSDSASRVGAIVIWPSMSGVVVANKSSRDQPTDSTNIDVFYPSHKWKGQLKTSPLSSLKFGEKPKFVVPLSALTKAALIELGIQR